MQSSLAVAVATALLLLPAAAPAQSVPTPPAKPNIVTLSGCVSAKPLPSGEYTFVEKGSGSKYRLFGKRLDKWAGLPVEIKSGPLKGTVVGTQLWPSPNIAAQQGALDPALEAIARQPGAGYTSGTGDVTLPMLNVARVRGLSGPCQ